MIHASSSLAVSLLPFQGFVRRLFRASPLSVIGQARSRGSYTFELSESFDTSGKSLGGISLGGIYFQNTPKTSNSASNIRLEYFRMACSPGKSLEVADHEELCFCDRCQNREAEGERRAAKRQVFCWRATTAKRGPRGADQKRSRVSSRHRRRQRTSQRSPSIHVRFHAPGPSHRQLGVRAPIDKRTSHRFRTRFEVSSWPSSAVARRGWSVSAPCG